eukprot:SAG31_NODE_22233_length_530_cov_3.125290_1_plen_84_part_10
MELVHQTVQRCVSLQQVFGNGVRFLTWCLIAAVCSVAQRDASQVSGNSYIYFKIFIANLQTPSKLFSASRFPCRSSHPGPPGAS